MRLERGFGLLPDWKSPKVIQAGNHTQTGAASVERLPMPLSRHGNLLQESPSLCTSSSLPLWNIQVVCSIRAISGKYSMSDCLGQISRLPSYLCYRWQDASCFCRILCSGLWLRMSAPSRAPDALKPGRSLQQPDVSDGSLRTSSCMSGHEESVTAHIVRVKVDRPMGNPRRGTAKAYIPAVLQR